QNSPQEHIPDTRDRWSLSARLNRFLPRLHSAVHFDARFYDDTWGVIAGDAELGYSQYIGKSLLLKIHARIYQQRAAKFFKDAFYYETESTAGAYFTGDRELSPVRNAMFGGKLTLITLGGDHPVWGLFDKLQFNVKADVLMLDVLPADNLANNPIGIDKQFIYGNSLIDAVILQLGLTGNYGGPGRSVSISSPATAASATSGTYTPFKVKIGAALIRRRWPRTVGQAAAAVIHVRTALTCATRVIRPDFREAPGCRREPQAVFVAAVVENESRTFGGFRGTTLGMHTHAARDVA